MGRDFLFSFPTSAVWLRARGLEATSQALGPGFAPIGVTQASDFTSGDISEGGGSEQEMACAWHLARCPVRGRYSETLPAVGTQLRPALSHAGVNIAARLAPPRVTLVIGARYPAWGLLGPQRSEGLV